MTETHPEKRLIGYARVSTYGQTLAVQPDQLRAAGRSSRNIYREKVMGARPDRASLTGCSASWPPATCDRDAASRAAAPSTCSALLSPSWAPRPQFRSLAEPWADTGTSTGDLMLAVLGGLGDVERDLERAPPKAGATPRSGWRGTEPLSAAGSVWHRVDWSYWGYWHWHCVPIAHVYHHNQGTRLEHS